jgi:hypothetical protein
MQRFARQELAAGVLFFASCGILLVDALLSVPRQAPSLLPLVPMFIAIFWYVGIEHVRSRQAPR